MVMADSQQQRQSVPRIFHSAFPRNTPFILPPTLRRSHKIEHCSTISCLGLLVPWRNHMQELLLLRMLTKKQNAELDNTAVKFPIMEPPRGLCLLGWNINTQELRRHTVIPDYLRIAMAEAVRSKVFVCDERRHKSNGQEKSPEAPLVVFINTKSGAGARLGPQLKNQLQELISQEQVFDLSVVKPEEFFQHGLHCLEELASNGDLCAQETRDRIRVLVAGGDGTVGWVLGSISGLPLEKCKQIPPVGIIPLGTGNDLARSFGWGGTFSFAWRSEVKKYLLKAVNSRVCPLDSWHVVVKITDGQNVEFPHALKPQRHSLVTQDGELDRKSHGNVSSFDGVFHNYFSIGMDAQVAYGFHHLRNKRPYLARGPFSNKMVYAVYSCTQGWFCTSCSNNPQLSGINNIVRLYIRRRKGSAWEEIAIPSSVRAIVALNLQNYAGGRNPWGHPNPKYLEKKGFGQAQADDGLIEIFGLKNGWHTSFVMADLITAKHLSQALDLKLELGGSQRKQAYMQMDGEPWKQPLSNIHSTVIEIARAPYQSLILNANRNK